MIKLQSNQKTVKIKKYCKDLSPSKIPQHIEDEHYQKDHLNF